MLLLPLSEGWKVLLWFVSSEVYLYHTDGCLLPSLSVIQIYEDEGKQEHHRNEQKWDQKRAAEDALEMFCIC